MRETYKNLCLVEHGVGFIKFKKCKEKWRGLGFVTVVEKLECFENVYEKAFEIIILRLYKFMQELILIWP